MNEQSIMERLTAPFPASEIEWRLQRSGEYNGTLKGYAVPYIDARAIAARLDEVFGMWGWQDSYAPWHVIENGNIVSQLCTIYIYCEVRNEWIPKCDGAENSDIEPIKGGLSDAFKRAAVKWGVGRYLYQMSGVWVEAEKKGKSTVIKDSENARLEKIYNETVAKIFNAAPPKTIPKAAAAEGLISTIASIKESNTASGTNSLLELVDSKGNKVKTYLKGQHPELGQGVRLTNVKITRKDGTHGPYNMMESYELAA